MTKHVFRNTLYTNNNLYVLSGRNSESVDLVSLDPSFNTKRMYSAPIESKAAGTIHTDMAKGFIRAERLYCAGWRNLTVPFQRVTEPGA